MATPSLTAENASIPETDGSLSYASTHAIEQHFTPVLSAVLSQLFAPYNKKSRIRGNQPICQIISKKELQKRGIDLALHFEERTARDGPCTVDFKIDTYDTGNLALELIAQCRGNSARNGPDLGCVFKDMQWIAYYLVQVGDLYFFDMAQVFPWLQSRIEDAVGGATPRTPAFPYWLAGVPNKGYQTYNLMLTLEQFLADCPGVYLLRLPEYVSMEQLIAPLQDINNEREAANKANAHRVNFIPHKLLRLRSPLTTSPAARKRMRTPYELSQLMLKGNCYHLKDKLSAEKMERLLRWCEQHKQYKPYGKRKGEELQATRPRFTLEEDRPYPNRA
jgi:hypothetical protein